jgi:hypothetical protein
MRVVAGRGAADGARPLARFLVLVMRRGGVCIRQYAGFARIANGGRRCNAFFDKLVKRGKGDW